MRPGRPEAARRSPRVTAAARSPAPHFFTALFRLIFSSLWFFLKDGGNPPWHLPEDSAFSLWIPVCCHPGMLASVCCVRNCEGGGSGIVARSGGSHCFCCNGDRSFKVCSLCIRGYRLCSKTVGKGQTVFSADQAAFLRSRNRNGPVQIGRLYLYGIGQGILLFRT